MNLISQSHKTIIQLLVITTFIFSTGCDHDDHFYGIDKIHGSGEIVTRTLLLDSFSEIQLEGVSNVYVTIGESQSTIVKAQQNIIDVMTWEVISNKLIIGLKDNIGIENSEEIRFEIVIPEIHEITHHGVGDFYLTGPTIPSLEIYFSGVGDINSYYLPTNQCIIISSGVGDCKIESIDFLDVNISGVGNVYYRGNPEIESTITGIGQLINNN
jgi:Putative auto-transporter adhesin, head GIN domain